ncbi:hypothetical protein PQR71_07540 [Paraburkholderia fungorum]|uniref:hypothetical protein n=1 Tax=Paraburkholderia fungorum TaxID=134537 RepID=UPI0038B7E94D
MKVETMWVQPPPSIGGLDHLGAQAPCVLIYGQLLPGITNVTDRARYYSFYPWVIWSIAQRFPDNVDEATFVERFRRADCLFTLVAEHHARCTDNVNERHGAAMVGRQKLVAAVQRIMNGETLNLATFTADESDQRYFMNPMGGLSQYYAGTLADLGILVGAKKPWFQFTKEIGKPLAEAFDASVPADSFWDIVERGVVAASDLNRLHAFCPCQLRHPDSDERKQLVDIYFDRQRTYAEEGTQRKRSLALIQRLIENLPPGSEFSEFMFRAAVYGSSLPDSSQWVVPADLASTRDNWAVYVRNDLLSVAAQTIFALSLNKLAPQIAGDRHDFGTVEALASWFKEGKEVAGLLDKAGCATFGEWLVDMQASLPAIEEWSSEGHEMWLADGLVSQSGRASDEELLERAMRVFAILAIRDDLSRAPYEGLAIAPQALHDYPINLYTFRRKVEAWRAMSLDEVASDLVAWCMNTHLRVSLRKLHRTSRATFRFRPSERGLELTDGDIPAPSRTTPRFRQAFQILIDVGAVVRDDEGQTSLSAEGKQLMEAASV